MPAPFTLPSPSFVSPTLLPSAGEATASQAIPRGLRAKTAFPPHGAAGASPSDAPLASPAQAHATDGFDDALQVAMTVQAPGKEGQAVAAAPDDAAPATPSLDIHSATVGRAEGRQGWPGAAVTPLKGAPTKPAEKRVAATADRAPETDVATVEGMVALAGGTPSAQAPTSPPPSTQPARHAGHDGRGAIGGGSAEAAGAAAPGASPDSGPATDTAMAPVTTGPQHPHLAGTDAPAGAADAHGATPLEAGPATAKNAPSTAAHPGGATSKGAAEPAVAMPPTSVDHGASPTSASLPTLLPPAHDAAAVIPAPSPVSAVTPSSAAQSLSPASATQSSSPASAAGQPPPSTPQPLVTTRMPAAAQLTPAFVALAAPSQAGAPQRLLIRMDPAGLGHVQIRIDHTAEGPAHVVLAVERSDTLMLLLQDRPQLNQALTAAGVSPEGRTLQFSLGDPGGGSTPGGMGTGGGGGNAGSGHDTADGEPPPRQPDAALAWQRAGIDITA